MKIIIKESDLRNAVKESIVEYLNRPVWLDPWHDVKEYPLTEGLTCSYNIGKVLGILRRRFSKEINNKTLIINSSVDFNRNSKDNFLQTINPINSFKTTQDTDNWFKIEVEFPKGIRNNTNLPDEITKVCEACGWFFTNFFYLKRDPETFALNAFAPKTIDYNDEWLMKQQIVMLFRAKFNVEYKEKSVPSILFHIAPVRVLDRIKKQGLTPRANGRQEIHPERVYCYLDKPANWHKIADSFRQSNMNEPYVLLGIEKDKINPKIKFYYDSNTYSEYPTAIYTNEPIPPNAITIIEIEDINNNETSTHDK